MRSMVLIYICRNGAKGRPIRRLAERHPHQLLRISSDRLKRKLVKL